MQLSITVIGPFCTIIPSCVRLDAFCFGFGFQVKYDKLHCQLV